MNGESLESSGIYLNKQKLEKKVRTEKINIMQISVNVKQKKAKKITVKYILKERR